MLREWTYRPRRLEPHVLGDKYAHGVLGHVKVPGHLTHGTFGVTGNPASDGGFESRRADRTGAAAKGTVICGLTFLVSSPGPANENPRAVERTANLRCRRSRNLQVYDGAAEWFVGEDEGIAAS